MPGFCFCFVFCFFPATNIVTDALLLLAGSPQKKNPSQATSQLIYTVSDPTSGKRNPVTPPTKRHSVQRSPGNEKQAGRQSTDNQTAFITSTIPYVRALDFNLEKGPAPSKRGHKNGSKNKKGTKQSMAMMNEQSKVPLNKKGAGRGRRHAVAKKPSELIAALPSDTSFDVRNVQATSCSTVTTNIGVGQSPSNYSSTINRTILANLSPVNFIMPNTYSTHSPYNFANSVPNPTTLPVSSVASPTSHTPSAATIINPATGLSTGVSPSLVSYTGGVESHVPLRANHTSLGTNAAPSHVTCPTPTPVNFTPLYPPHTPSAASIVHPVMCPVPSTVSHSPLPANIVSTSANHLRLPANLNSTSASHLPLPANLVSTGANHSPSPAKLVGTGTNHSPLPANLNSTSASHSPLPSNLVSTGANHSPLPAHLNSTGANHLPLPAHLNSTGASYSPLPGHLNSIGANHSPLPANLNSTSASHLPLPANLVSTGANHSPLPANLVSTGANHSPLPANLNSTSASHSPLPANLVSTGANHSLLPANLNSTSASHLPLPAHLNSTGANHSPLPAHLNSTGANHLPLPAHLNSTGANYSPLPAHLNSTGANHPPLPANLNSTSASHSLSPAILINTGVRHSPLPASLVNTSISDSSLPAGLVQVNPLAISSATSAQVVNTVAPLNSTGVTQAGRFADSTVVNVTASIGNPLTGQGDHNVGLPSGSLPSASSDNADTGTDNSSAHVEPFSFKASSLLTTLALKHANAQTSSTQIIASGLDAGQLSTQSLQKNTSNSTADVPVGHQHLKEKSSSHGNMNASTDNGNVLSERENISLVHDSSSVNPLEQELRGSVSTEASLQNSLENRNGSASSLAILNQECSELMKENSAGFSYSKKSSERVIQGSSNPQAKRKREAIQPQKVKLNKNEYNNNYNIISSSTMLIFVQGFVVYLNEHHSVNSSPGECQLSIVLHCNS